jgi:hypothetical protein
MSPPVPKTHWTKTHPKVDNSCGNFRKNTDTSNFLTAMLDMISSTVRPLLLDDQVLEVAYGLYMEAASGGPPAISLKQLSNITGKTPLRCRNAIVEANELGRFPNCELHP